MSMEKFWKDCSKSIAGTEHTTSTLEKDCSYWLPSRSATPSAKLDQNFRAREDNQDEFRRKIRTTVESECQAKPIVTTIQSNCKPLTRGPVECPITQCKRTIASSAVMSHYMVEHHDQFGLQYREIYTTKAILMLLKETNLKFNQCVCLGLLAYAGANGSRCSLPAERRICAYNQYLPASLTEFHAHMPILIMACQTSVSMLSRSEEFRKAITDSSIKEDHIFLFWLVSTVSTKEIWCTLSLFNHERTWAKSSLLKCRHFHQSQLPNVFIHNDINFLFITRKELDIASADGAKDIQFEVIIQDEVAGEAGLANKINDAVGGKGDDGSWDNEESDPKAAAEANDAEYELLLSNYQLESMAGN